MLGLSLIIMHLKNDVFSMVAHVLLSVFKHRYLPMVYQLTQESIIWENRVCQFALSWNLLKRRILLEFWSGGRF